MARRRGIRNRWVLTEARRDFALFILGVAGLVFLTVLFAVTGAEPPTILVLGFLGLMGLPVALGVDERTRRNDDDDDDPPRRG